ncbi:MAG: radical SAM protein [Sandaracinaceae bacterium]
MSRRHRTEADYAAPHPVYCVWELTLACDLGCRHCGSRAKDARAGELTTEECLDVVAQLEELGVREVTLIGGEAYLRDDWDMIAAAITSRGMVCGMTTGARGLDAERVARAEAAGLRSISVSIDGLERTHDTLRGARGSFRAVAAAAERVARSSMALSANTQINRLGAPELAGLARRLVELGVGDWQLALTVPMGRAADRPDLLLQPYELLEVFPLIAWVRRAILDPAGLRLRPGNNVGYFGPYEELVRWRGHEGAHFTKCSAGSFGLGLEADGTVKGCPSLPTQHYAGGNVRERPLADIVRRTAPLASLRDRTVDDLWGFCRTCYYAEACLGGCSWTAHCWHGRPGNNTHCIHRALTLEEEGLRERCVRVDAAPGEPFDHGRFDIVVEPMPPAAEATICGVPVERVRALSPTDPSLVSADERRTRLRVV